MGRLAGIDYGRKRIGLALSDTGEKIASPAGTLSGSGDVGQDARQVTRWALEQEATGIVVGLPLSMDGSDSEQTRLVRRFAAALRKSGSLSVECWDERLSSFAADEVLKAADLRPAVRKRLRDALAAQVILQAFLNARGAAAAE